MKKFTLIALLCFLSSCSYIADTKQKLSRASEERDYFRALDDKYISISEKKEDEDRKLDGLPNSADHFQKDFHNARIFNSYGCEEFLNDFYFPATTPWATKKRHKEPQGNNPERYVLHHDKLGILNHEETSVVRQLKIVKAVEYCEKRGYSEATKYKPYVEKYLKQHLMWTRGVLWWTEVDLEHIRATYGDEIADELKPYKQRAKEEY